LSCSLERPWYKSYDQGVNRCLDYPENTIISDFITRSAVDFPQKSAIIFMGNEISYQLLDVYVNRAAAALAGLGVKKGDRVAIMAPNCPQYIISYHGVLRAGGIVVQVNPMYVERELEHILNDSGAEIIIAYDALYPRIKAVKDFTPLKSTILFHLGQPVADFGGEVQDFNSLLASATGEPPRYDFNVTEDVAVLQYTGGTTGVSKGAMLTHRNILANVLQASSWVSEAKYGTEIVLTIIPLFHSYGMSSGMNYAIYNAATDVLLPKFDINDVMDAINKYKPTVIPGVPTLYIAIINHPDVSKFDLSSIKYCISGSATLPLEVAHKFHQLTGGTLVEGYGLSETSPSTHCQPLNGVQKEGSIGLPFPDVDVKIVDVETGTRELPPNELGELIMKGPMAMKGYWNMPEETANTLRNGWIYTGDIARMDEDGYFFIIDRKKDMIIAGGFNIYPRDIEEVLFEYPKVQEAVIVGVPDPYRGETVKAFIVLKAGEAATEEEIIGFCKQKLAAYKVPRQVEFRDQLPKTIVGKVLRRYLREEEMAKQK